MLLNFTLLFMFFHFLCDYALQNDYIAQAKNRNTKLGMNVWGVVLLAHAAIHSLPILITGLILFGFNSPFVSLIAIFQLLTHFIIDFCKCEEKISYLTDQALHLLISCFTALIFTLKMSGV